MARSESPTEGLDLEGPYGQLQAHLEAEPWIEAIAVCYRILDVEPDYRDVSQLLARAREQLALEREQSRIAKEAWRGAQAPVTERTRPRRRWFLVLLIFGLGACLFSAALTVVILRSQGRLPAMQARPEPGATARPVQGPSAPMAIADMQLYTNSEGRFLLKYPQT